jgi:small-conductance mechanosensitive channel
MRQKRLTHRLLVNLTIIGVMAVACSTIPVTAQEGATDMPPVPLSPPSSTTETPTPTDNGLYFADVLVRGRPIFQVGSLVGISAVERANTINRRIASILARSDAPGTVTVQARPEQSLAMLQLNNRVIMTVTEQDAKDFGATPEQLAEEWAERLNDALNKPPLAIDVAQRLDGTIRQLMRDAVDRLPSLIGAVLMIMFTWFLAAGFRRIALVWAHNTEGDRSTELLLGRLAYGGIWVFGSTVALGVLGLNIAALLGALGLTSVAIGFSLKDVLSNYISGVVLLSARPFRLGDQIVIKEFEGTVTQIQLRSTTLTTYDGRVVYIPNQEVFQASITNNTASVYRRSSVMVGIDYDADISTVIRIIQDAVIQVAGVNKDSKPEILVQELAASTVNLEIRFWVNSHRANFLETTSSVTQAIKEALQAHAIEMPTDIYTLVFRDSPPLVKPPESRDSNPQK